MAFTTVPAVVTGQAYLASDYNTYVKDNLNTLNAGTTAGDMVYWTAATTPTRLAIGTSGHILTSNGTAPTWAHPDVVHSTGGVTAYGTQSTTSVSPVTVSSMGFTISTTRKCDILVTGSACGLTSDTTGSQPIVFNVVCNASSDGDFRNYSPYATGLGIAVAFLNVASGNNTIVLQFSSPFGNSVTAYGGYLIALAYPTN